MAKIRIALGAFAVLITLAGCGDSAEVKMVKGGKLQMCPNATVEEMVDGFLGDPSWESGKSNDGQEFVNVEGKMTFQEKEVTAKVQFFINKDRTSFQYNAFEMNDIPQNNFIASALLSKMCESVKN